tara:strand:- start:2815 stop:3039 length:225 start_codon:yes stop_codon:yes gene_type:complete
MNIKRDMPIIGTTVLIYSDYGVLEVGNFDGMHWVNNTNGRFRDDTTHWMYPPIGPVKSGDKYCEREKKFVHCDV